MWLLLALSGCSPIGIKNLERVLSEGIERQYVVHVPKHVKGERAPALVIMLHGTSGTGQRFYSISGWVEKADSLVDDDVIVAFPTALEYCIGGDDGGVGPEFDADTALNGRIDDNEWRITTKWNAGQIGSDSLPVCPSDVLRRAVDAGARLPVLDEVGGRLTQALRSDEQFLRAMLDDLAVRYGYDRDRVYLTGFSNGGEMAMLLSFRMEDELAAVASASGSLGYAVEGANPPRPYVMSGGSKDPGMLSLSSDPETGKPLDELPLDDSLFLQDTFAEIQDQVTTIGHLSLEHSSSISEAYGATRGVFRYTDSELELDNVAEIWVVDEVTHEYPNGSNSPFSMPDALWDFFQRG